MTLPSALVPYPSIEGTQCPFPFWKFLRNHAPVYQLEDRPECFVVSRYEDVRFCVENREVFTSESVRTAMNGFNILLGTDVQGDAPQSTANRPMNDCDGERHKQKRDLARGPVKPGRLKGYEPLIESIVDELIAAFVQNGRVEFIEQFAYPLPVKLTIRLLGLPEEDLPWIREWGTFEGAGLTWMPQEFQRAQMSRGALMQKYLTDHLRARHQAPREDAMSEVILAQIARDGRFDLDDVCAQVAILMAGGIITTAHFLGNAMLMLLRNPGQMKKVRADQSRIPIMIEEALRLDSPAPWSARRVLKDTTLSGVSIPKGSFVLLMWGSANRDETQFKDAEQFDVDRRGPIHMAFGYGPHFCLGAPLARLESRIAFERLFSALGEIRLASDRELRYIDSASFRGLTHLDLEFDERKPAA